MRPIDEAIGLGRELRTQQLLRSFDDDLAFYQNSAISPEVGRDQTNTAITDGNAPGRSPGGPIVDVPAGPVGVRIAAVASQLVGTENTLYYRDPEHPCASFVSTVLQDAGPFADGTLQRACSALAVALLRHGAVQVIADGTRVSDTTAGLALRPGDVIMFHHASDIYHHTGIYVGSGTFVGTSSSRYHVLSYVLSRWPSHRYFAAFRFP